MQGGTPADALQGDGVLFEEPEEDREEGRDAFFVVLRSETHRKFAQAKVDAPTGRERKKAASGKPSAALGTRLLCKAIAREGFGKNGKEDPWGGMYDGGHALGEDQRDENDLVPFGQKNAYDMMIAYPEFLDYIVTKMADTEAQHLSKAQGNDAQHNRALLSGVLGFTVPRRALSDFDRLSAPASTRPES